MISVYYFCSYRPRVTRVIDVYSLSVLQVKFHDGEVITWNKVTTTINNLILGKIYVEHSGTMRVQSDCTSKEMRIKFKDSGSVFGTSKRQVSGAIYDNSAEVPGFRCSYQSLDRPF
jgi:oxysterol-binding protein 1